MHRTPALALGVLAAACGTGHAHDITEDDAPAARAASNEDGEPEGTLVWSTYYYRASESDYEGPPRTTLVDSSCAPVGTVSEAFARAVCIEGSGRLADGRGINVDGRCECASPCANGSRVCWQVLGDDRPWGLGNRNNALEPFVSWATDRGVIPSGEVIYAPEWDGVEIPVVDGLGGFEHDGCFRADDVGGAIDGDHVDVFVGTRAMWRAMEGVRPTRSRQHAVIGSARCAHLRR